MKPSTSITRPPHGSTEEMQAIREVVHQVVPEAEEVISYQIPCFKFKKYTESL